MHHLVHELAGCVHPVVRRQVFVHIEPDALLALQKVEKGLLRLNTKCYVGDILGDFENTNVPQGEVSGVLGVGNIPQSVGGSKSGRRVLLQRTKTHSIYCADGICDV